MFVASVPCSEKVLKTARENYAIQIALTNSNMSYFDDELSMKSMSPVSALPKSLRLTIYVYYEHYIYCDAVFEFSKDSSCLSLAFLSQNTFNSLRPSVPKCVKD